MHLDTWAEISLLVFGGIFSLIAVGLLGAMAFALTKLGEAIGHGDSQTRPGHCQSDRYH